MFQYSLCWKPGIGCRFPENINCFFCRENEPVQKKVYFELVKLLRQSVSQGSDPKIESSFGKMKMFEPSKNTTRY